MKNLLLFLLALIVVAPAWAGDAAPDTETGVVIELKGSTKSVGALAADLEKEAVYKEAACSTASAKKTGKTAKISCAKADGALLTFLVKNAPANVHWSISAAASKALSSAANKSILSCPTGCTLTHCPVPAGPIVCCKNNVPC